MKKLISALWILLAVQISAAGIEKVYFDTAASPLKWTASKVGGKHNGLVSLTTNSYLEFSGSKILSGRFEIDLRTVINEDLTDAKWNKMLLESIKGPDLFNTAKYPLCVYVIDSSVQNADATVTLKGRMTLLNETRAFETKLTAAKDVRGRVLTGKAVVSREKFKLKFGSGTFKGGMSEMVIHDEFTLEILLREKL